MKGDTLHIYFSPEDFDMSNRTRTDDAYDFANPRGCALVKALIRQGFTDVFLDTISGGFTRNKKEIRFRIPEIFNFDDFLFVKRAYRKDPEMKKAEYYVTLIEQ